jgi:hypothetical protein
MKLLKRLYWRIKYGKCKNHYLVMTGQFVFDGHTYYPVGSINDLKDLHYVSEERVTIVNRYASIAPRRDD